MAMAQARNSGLEHHIELPELLELDAGMVLVRVVRSAAIQSDHAPLDARMAYVKIAANPKGPWVGVASALAARVF